MQYMCCHQVAVGLLIPFQSPTTSNISTFDLFHIHVFQKEQHLFSHINFESAVKTVVNRLDSSLAS